MDFRGVDLERDVPVRMQDGTILSADVYRPSKCTTAPVLLLRTPYNKTIAQTGVYQHPAWYARQGYVVIIQDTRGRYASEGKFEPYVHEQADGLNTLAWASSLDGSNGRVGTYGFSYCGTIQLLVAMCRPPALKCIAFGCAASNFFDGWTYRGGALQLAFVLSWGIETLALPDAVRAKDSAKIAELRRLTARMREIYESPLEELAANPLLPSYLRKWITDNLQNEYWESTSSIAEIPNIEVPCLMIGGWYDIFLEGTLQVHRMLVESGTARWADHRLLVGPWRHVPWSRINGPVDYGISGDSCADELQIEWFDRWLKEEQAEDRPAVRYFLMGANEWRNDRQWPPSNAIERTYYLHSHGSAGRTLSDGKLSLEKPGPQPPDIYVYDPRNPVESAGGASCCNPALAPVGATDQKTIEARTDVLTYTTAPMDGDLDMAGPVEVVLYATTDAVDTDWTAKLVDIYPDGTALNVCDGIVRSSHCNSLTSCDPIVPGKIYRYQISMGATAIRLFTGHSLRVEISSSNFPAYDVNRNTGKGSKSDEVFIATQIVYHDREHPSHLRFHCLSS